MRKLLFIVFCLSSISSWAQSSISDCDGAIVLCGDLYTETQASLKAGNVIEATGGCNQGVEQNSVWYTFTVQADGNLSFILDPLNDVDDYDWGLFNITTGGCAGLGTTSLRLNATATEIFHLMVLLESPLLTEDKELLTDPGQPLDLLSMPIFPLLWDKPMPWLL